MVYYHWLLIRSKKLTKHEFQNLLFNKIPAPSNFPAHIYYVFFFYNVIYENDRIERCGVAAKIKRQTFRNFLRLMMKSLSVIHYYRAKYSHMTGICAYTMTEIRSEGNPKFLSTAKCIIYDWWKTVPNNTRASKHQLVTYIIMLFHPNFFYD